MVPDPVKHKPERMLVIAAAVVAAAAATDTHALFEEDWSHHQIWSGLVSGGVILIVGYAIFERWLEKRATLRWTTVSILAFKALGRSCDALRQGMNELVTGDYDLAEGSPLEASMRRAIREARHRSRADGAATLQERLERLLADPHWVKLAVDALDIHKVIQRKAIAEWASVMLTTEDLQKVLNGLALLNQEVFDLQDQLRDVRDGQRGDAAQQDALRCWRKTAVDALCWQEHLMRATTTEKWQHHHGRTQLAEWAGDADGWHDQMSPRSWVRKMSPHSWARQRQAPASNLHG